MNRARRHKKTALRPTENGSRGRLIARLGRVWLGATQTCLKNIEASSPRTSIRNDLYQPNEA